MEKIKIKNRKNQNIVVLLDETADSKGLAFVMHGLGGFKEQKHLEVFAGAFKKKALPLLDLIPLIHMARAMEIMKMLRLRIISKT